MAVELDSASATRAFGDAYFNLIRRGADGSLKLSADHWRLDAEKSTSTALVFAAQEQDAPDLAVPLDQVERITWDRLPKQQQRSQIRFYMTGGDLWTFSGTVDEAALPD
jgi:hypothetical protein